MDNENKVLEELKERFQKQNKPKNKALDADTAIEKAYADMSRRAKGHTPKVKKKCMNELKKIFDDIPTFKTEEDFDRWHKNSCDKLRNTELPNGFVVTYGRAQKVINMAFKYLMYTDTPHKDAHAYCHMTLDSYTLAWYRRMVSPNKKYIAWSKIDNYDEYMGIQKKIREYLKSNVSYSIDVDELKNTATIELPKQPFLAEFITWEGEKLLEKYKKLVKGKATLSTSEKENDFWLIGDSLPNL